MFFVGLFRFVSPYNCFVLFISVVLLVLLLFATCYIFPDSKYTRCLDVYKRQMQHEMRPASADRFYAVSYKSLLY